MQQIVHSLAREEQRKLQTDGGTLRPTAIDHNRAHVGRGSDRDQARIGERPSLPTAVAREKSECAPVPNTSTKVCGTLESALVVMTQFSDSSSDHCLGEGVGLCQAHTLRPYYCRAMAMRMASSGSTR